MNRPTRMMVLGFFISWLGLYAVPSLEVVALLLGEFKFVLGTFIVLFGLMVSWSAAHMPECDAFTPDEVDDGLTGPDEANLGQEA